jgi:hypothetical protein
MRFHERRQQQTSPGMRLLEAEEERNYLAPDERQLGPLYMIAEPHLPENQDRLNSVRDVWTIQNRRG